MASETTDGPARPVDGRYPTGTGWVAGYALGVVVGVLSWLVSGEVTLGLILLVATGTPLSVAIEGSLDTRPLTARERRLAVALGFAGVVVGVAVLLYVIRLA
ncbi:MAG: hypothetical protein ABEJ28_02320 [Salinigranum sp.]